MTTRRQPLYVTYPAQEPGALEAGRSESLFDNLYTLVVTRLKLSEEVASALRVTGYPTAQWHLAIGGRKHEIEQPLQVVQLELRAPEARMNNLLEVFLGAARSTPGWNAGADLVGEIADYWCPVDGDPSFGTRANLDARIGVAAISDLRGTGVNVVIVDRGLDQTKLPPGSFGGGWAYTPDPTNPGTTILPGTARDDDAEHGLMLARNILTLAPEARLFDLPIIPPRILDIPLFIASAHSAYVRMSGDIAWLHSQPGASGPWVVVNAWALFDRRSDLPGPGGVGSDGSHPFHSAVQAVTATGSDVVFVAGNCGQYCPDDRCGPSDIGPGYSISGPNAYAEVLTVGAVRVDGLPLGYSSQGPGLITAHKPDLCAPSNFTETFDPGQVSSGTSAACAVAAGVVAALRTRATVTPAAMILALRQGAGGANCDPQFGFGTLDVAATRGILGI